MVIQIKKARENAPRLMSLSVPRLADVGYPSPVPRLTSPSVPRLPDVGYPSPVPRLMSLSVPRLADVGYPSPVPVSYTHLTLPTILLV